MLGLMPLFTVISLLLLTADDPAIVDCVLGADADRLMAISDECDAEDTDNDGGFCEGAHAAKSQALNTTPLNTGPHES